MRPDDLATRHARPDVGEHRGTRTPRPAARRRLLGRVALMPDLLDGGHRDLRRPARLDGYDHVVAWTPTSATLLLGGIRSPGSPRRWRSPSTRDRPARRRLDTSQRADLPPTPRMPNVGEAFPRPYADAARIAEDQVQPVVVTSAGARPAAICATRSPRRSRPPTSTAYDVFRTRAHGPGDFFCGAEGLARLLDEPRHLEGLR